ncbi:MAG: sulfatase-like hydrolase/transferase, partial [Bryobacterales bacterium]|nr:sulfatase-like hydrolase/transferase [Bryobacterales bacterium]
MTADRRAFLSGAIAAAGAVCAAPGARLPNILWITCEDIGPHLGAFGCADSRTPHLDRLAGKGMRFPFVWSNAPVCAPARTAILTGMYPQSLGAQHMRSLVPFAAGLLSYPEHLRLAGYYCTNNAKTDYNLAVQPAEIWNESSAKAHWKNRAEGQPFFAVFNLEMTHESQIRRRPHVWVHDPAKVRIPAYHPDNEDTRKDWAQYHDQISEMDARAGELLREVEAAGLTGDTVVFFFGDNGPGLPRNKRDGYNAGLHVPLIVYLPEKWKSLAAGWWAPGKAVNRLVEFVDLAPTVLSIAGRKAPANFQGRAFLGVHASAGPEFLFGMMDRMGERYDLIRTVRDRRYVYLRNFMPHRPHGPAGEYGMQTPTTRVWKALYDAGKLRGPQRGYWEPKEAEELYDLENDGDEVKNLAGSAAHGAVLTRFRAALREHVLRIRDTGFLPENELHERSRGTTPWEMARDGRRYPLERIFGAADAASRPEAGAMARLLGLAEDADSAVRYWGVMGILMRGRDAVRQARMVLVRRLEDDAAAVRIVAAEALARYGEDGDAAKAMDVLVSHIDPRKNSLTVVIAAMNSLDAAG